MPEVFVGVQKPDGGTTVFPAREYQASAFYTFMSNPSIVKIYFNYPTNIIFNLQKFDTSGLKGDYSTFCELKNESGQTHILSDNIELLRGFVGWKNRLTMLGGYKKQSTKRKHVTKKKSTKKK